jgi:hypothetical protein
MIREMEAIGLKVFEPTVKKIVLGENPDYPDYIKPGVGQPINDSMTLIWPLVEFIPRRIPSTSFRMKGKKGWYIPRFDHRLIADDATVHETVHERIEIDLTYRPPNLPRRNDPN